MIIELVYFFLAKAGKYMSEFIKLIVTSISAIIIFAMTPNKFTF